MKKLQLVLTIVAIIATLLGIVLLGNVSNFIVGGCFIIAAIAFFSSAGIFFHAKKSIHKK
ncbi:MAG: hypothetical protein IJ335_07005 [Lachnospiraceae bacterium]|nr:hypothetical protein [Lachnospiraceae bacterium]